MRAVTRIRPLVLVALLAVAGLTLYTGYAPLWRLLLLVVPLVLAGFVWVKLGLRGVEISPLDLPARCQVGESLAACAVVKNTGPLPKYMLKISQTATMPSYDNRLALNLPGRASYKWRADVPCTSRGRYTISPFSLEISDPFGVFRSKKSVGAPKSVLVYPAVKELSLAPLLGEGNVQSSRKWFTGRSGGDISRIREYAQGDSLSRIHWRTTAHTGQLMVKDFSQDRVRNVWVVLDIGAPGEPPAASEPRATVAASLARYYIEKGYPVGLISTEEVVLPRPGEKHYWFIMESLALLRPRASSPAELFAREAKRFKNGSLVFVVTSRPDGALLQRLSQINSAGGSTVLLLPGEKASAKISAALFREFSGSNVPAYLAS